MKMMFIYGTRPEAIKMAPLIKHMKEDSSFNVKVVLTGQHREMLEQVNSFFDIKPDYNLDVMTDNQSLFSVTTKILSGLETILKKEIPDGIIVQGDTTSTFIGALAAYYNKIPIYHLEAGLRTWDTYSPFPEEGNRILTSRLAHFHFAPTENNKKNLLDEGIPKNKIYVTGNTGIDALLNAKHILEQKNDVIEDSSDQSLTKPYVLLTAHRRESFGQCFEDIFSGLLKSAENFPDWNFIYPMHPNPNIKKIVLDKIGNTPNFHILPPLSYPEFVKTMNNADIIVTDSGGVQEEAPSLGKPVLVIREKTERMEAVEAKTVRKIGVSSDSIYKNIKKHIESETLRSQNLQKENPYGDGKASQRILKIIKENL